MKRAEPAEPVTEIIWKFVRGDMSPTEFEQWACSDGALEKQLGELLYLDVISADYSSKDAIYGIKKSLKAFALSASNIGCGCIALADLADIQMGPDIDGVLGTFEERARRGISMWWLSADQCSVCEQWWLVAMESRINDVVFLKRLSFQEGQGILNEHRWPAEFDKFENLLRLGHERGHRWKYTGPLDPAVLWTAIDLARERPGIRISELAELLHLDNSKMCQLAEQASREEGVVIGFD